MDQLHYSNFQKSIFHKWNNSMIDSMTVCSVIQEPDIRSLLLFNMGELPTSMCKNNYPQGVWGLHSSTDSCQYYSLMFWGHLSARKPNSKCCTHLSQHSLCHCISYWDDPQGNGLGYQEILYWILDYSGFCNSRRKSISFFLVALKLMILF